MAVATNNNADIPLKKTQKKQGVLFFCLAHPPSALYSIFRIYTLYFEYVQKIKSYKYWSDDINSSMHLIMLF